jgi:hypothetical protein
MMTRPSHVTISTSLIVLVFILATFWFTYPQINALDSVPPHNDPMFSTWRLAWVAHQLKADPRHLLDANIIFPSYHSFLFSDAFLLLGLLATPLMWAGVPAIVAYNVMILASFVFTAIAAFVFVRHLTGSILAGAIGGAIFAFAPIRFGHYMHQELLWTGWIPLTLWALHRTIETGRWRHALLTGLFFTAQVYCSIYYAIFLTTFIAIVAIALILSRVLDLRSDAFRRLLVGAALSGVLAAPYIYLYSYNHKIVGAREEWEVTRYSAEPQNYLAAPSFNWLYGGTQAKYVKEDAQDETLLFPGFCAVVLGVIGLCWPPFSRVKLAYLIGLLAAFDLSLGLHGFTYRLLYSLPVFGGLRATARFSVFVHLALALFAGYGFTRLLERALPRAALATLLVVSVSGVLLLEYTNQQIPLQRAATKASTLSRWLRQQPPNTVVLELPVPTTDLLPGYDPHYVFESTFHWRPLINGYTAFVPPRYLHFIQRMETFPDTELSINTLRTSGADLIVVHTRWLRRRNEQQGLLWLKEQPDYRMEGEFSDHVGSVIVFRRVPGTGDEVASKH